MTVTGLLVATQPLTVVLVTVTTDVVETIIVDAVSPVDQLMFVGTDDVKLTDPPIQNDVGPEAEITGVTAFANTLTAIAFEFGEIHPFTSVTIAVYDPDEFTLIGFNVLPVDHVIPEEIDDSSSTCPPGQNDVGPFAVIVGGAGLAKTLTLTGFESGLIQPLAFAYFTV